MSKVKGRGDYNIQVQIPPIITLPLNKLRESGVICT